MHRLHSPATKPEVYWDRADKVVRDWSTGQMLPNYEGQCLVYSDMQGPVLLHTFLNQGKRQWQEQKPR
jgi:hypothetical protein